jgi:ubiquinone/menaquinone biosynthesis C-methylase UbiE
MNNKFFTYNDEKTNKVIFSLDKDFFWSRLYEWKWVMQFINKNDCILDACCGVYHPFKFLLSDYCNKVFACDRENLSLQNMQNLIIKKFGQEAWDNLDKNYFKKITFNTCGIEKMPYIDKFFNKVICISSLEHLENNIILDGLNEFYRVLKNDGKVLLTLDYPTKEPKDIIQMVKQVGFKIDGKYSYTLPKNAIYSDYFGKIRLYCFNMVLVKKDL